MTRPSAAFCLAVAAAVPAMLLGRWRVDPPDGDAAPVAAAVALGVLLVALLHVALPGFPVIVGRCRRCGDRMPLRNAAGRCARCGDDRLSVVPVGRAAGLVVAVAGYALAAYACGVLHDRTMRDPAAFVAFVALLLMFGAIVFGVPGGTLRARRCVFLDGVAPGEPTKGEW